MKLVDQFKKMALIYSEESFKIIGAAQEVHRELGAGFLEAVYQEALAIELFSQNIPFQEEKELRISYKDRILDKTYFADFICYDKIVLEIKALSKIGSEHEAQVLNYLKVTGYKLGLIINFGESSLKVKRLVS
ncbi:MAG: GxxExxY protein [Calditrichaceae bacterium]